MLWTENVHIIETIASIATKFCTTIKTTKFHFSDESGSVS